ncbi:MAG: right-handed parallel beta-helix repeat-containing protein [Chromatiales bacterium]
MQARSTRFPPVPCLRRCALAGWLASLALAGVAQAEIRVPDDYDTIQEAIDAIEDDPGLDDTIIVEAGTYEEDLRLISGITLQGEETARTLLLPESNGPTMSLTTLTDVTIRNFTFIDTDLAIRVRNSFNVTVASNVFTLGANGDGIEILDASQVDIINNTFFDTLTAIRRDTALADITNNIFSDNELAIAPEDIDTNISNNCFIDNVGDGPTGSDPELNDDALFVNTALRDFHLREGSPCIDRGLGTDVIDDTDADMGAYGGEFADALPFPIQGLTASDISGVIGSPSVRLGWTANGSYLVTNTVNPGRYQVYYDSDAPGPPYDGTDGASGSQPSPIDVGNVTEFDLIELSPDNTPPPAPVITGVAPSDQRIALSWTAVANAIGYSVRYGIASVDENEIDVGNVTSATISGLQNGVTYTLGVLARTQDTYFLNVKAFDSTGDSDHQSAFASEVAVPLGDLLESALSDTVTAIPEEVVPFPVLSGDGCFIATAAFGSRDAPWVLALRDFRDRMLLPTRPGRWLVQLYYTLSPPLAERLEAHPALKPVARLAVLPIATLALVILQPAPLLKTALLLALLTLAMLRVRSVRGRPA